MCYSVCYGSFPLAGLRNVDLLGFLYSSMNSIYCIYFYTEVVILCLGCNTSDCTQICIHAYMYLLIFRIFFSYGRVFIIFAQASNLKFKERIRLGVLVRVLFCIVIWLNQCDRNRLCYQLSSFHVWSFSFFQVSLSNTESESDAKCKLDIFSFQAIMQAVQSPLEFTRYPTLCGVLHGNGVHFTGEESLGVQP